MCFLFLTLVLSVGIRPPVGKDGKSGGMLSSKAASKKRKLSLEDDSTSPPLKTLKVEEGSAATPDKKVTTKKGFEKDGDKEADKASSSNKKDKADKEKEKESEKDADEEPSKTAKRGRGARTSLPKGSSTEEKSAGESLRQPFPVAGTEYAVDRIVSSRSIVGGRREYLLEAKPADSTDSDVTPLRLWFFDADLVAAVAAVSASPSTVSSASSSSDGAAKKSKKHTEAPLDPTKLTPEQLEALAPELPSLDEIDEVVGAKMIDRQLHLYVKWRGSAVASFLPASTAARLAPQKVIKFYESNLQFSDSDAK
jgi:hypothetical protein